MSKFTIYAITNVETTKKYVGSSSNFHKRKVTHLWMLETGKHHNIHLQRSYNLYGAEKFVFSILEEGEGSEDLKFEKEAFWIELLEPEYNIGPVGGGDCFTGHPNREKLLAARREKIANMTKEEKQAKWAMYGKDNPNWKGGCSKSYCTICGVDTKSKVSVCGNCRDRSGKNNPFYGKTHDEDTKALIGQKSREMHQANRDNPEYVHPQAKPIMADGVIYKSLGECAKAYGVTAASISYRARSKNYPNFYYLEKN